MLSDSIKQKVDTLLHTEIQKVIEEYGEDFAEGWLAGATWTLNTVTFFHRLEEMQKEYEGQRTR